MDYLRLTDDNRLEEIPEASRDEQLGFIDTYRQTQAENTAQIGEAAHALGSDLTAPYGGLHGPSEYMKSRYQTPQTESRIAGLRAAAQLDALNKMMERDLNRYKNLASQAYKGAVQRAQAASTPKGEVKTEEIPEYGNEPTLGVAAGEYGDEAPYGITRVYGQGAFDGKPLYTDTANDAEGNPTGAALSDGTIHITTPATTGTNTPEQVLIAPLATALFGPTAVPLLSLINRIRS